MYRLTKAQETTKAIRILGQASVQNSAHRPVRDLHPRGWFCDEGGAFHGVSLRQSHSTESFEVPIAQEVGRVDAVPAWQVEVLPGASEHPQFTV